MLCCICLLETPKMLGIFDVKGINLDIGNIINKYFWFKTNPDNVLTSHICTICWQKIEEFHEFYNSAEKIHKSFEKYQQADIKEEQADSIKQETDQDEDSFKNNIEEIDFIKVTKNGAIIVEKNPLESEQQQLDCTEGEFANEDSNMSDDYDYEPSVNSELENISNEELTENINIKIQVERNTTKRKKLNKLEGHNDALKKIRKRNSHLLDPILTEQLVKKHIPMLCDLCVFSGNTFSDIVAHFKDDHIEVQPYIMCCDRKFTRSYCIDQHAIIHENPDSFRCNDCNRSFTTTYGLRTHNLNHHAPEEKRIHACEFCPRRFGRRQLLEVHRQTHIPKEEWTITCTKCTTRTVKFVSQYLLNIHNSMFHRREANICHVCAKEIKDKKAFEKHVRAHFGDTGPRVKCTYPNCERWLKDEDNLRTHMQLHNLSGKTYKCTECEKECPNRRALTNHKRYVHSGHTFRCEECDKTFKKAISLKEHMTQHTGETLYKCPFCTRTFNSNANMHAHKKKQHPSEWKELRRKNLGPLPK